MPERKALPTNDGGDYMRMRDLDCYLLDDLFRCKTQSILAEAFLGELVPTEAELARIYGREYETATTLLKRVQQSSSQQPKRATKLSLRKTSTVAAGDVA